MMRQALRQSRSPSQESCHNNSSSGRPPASRQQSLMASRRVAKLRQAAGVAAQRVSRRGGMALVMMPTWTGC